MHNNHQPPNKQGVFRRLFGKKTSNTKQHKSVAMLPKVVVYKSVSVDGAIKDFDINFALHYEVANQISL